MNDDYKPKKRGRQPAKVRSTSLSLWIPIEDYDRLVEMANDRELSLSAFVRQLVTTGMAERQGRIVDAPSAIQ